MTRPESTDFGSLPLPPPRDYSDQAKKTATHLARQLGALPEEDRLDALVCFYRFVALTEVAQ